MNNFSQKSQKNRTMTGKTLKIEKSKKSVSLDPTRPCIHTCNRSKDRYTFNSQSDPNMSVYMCIVCVNTKAEYDQYSRFFSMCFDFQRFPRHCPIFLALLTLILQ